MIFTDIIILVVVLLLFFGAFLMLRALRFSKQAPEVEPITGMEVDAQQVTDHLARVIKIETISHQDDSETDHAVFEKLHAELAKMYPRLHKALKREFIHDGVLYTWEGSQPELAAVLFTSHIDVVPADPSTLNQWDEPPFSGTVKDGYIWGRGTLDIKSQVIAVMEAVESLLEKGFKPERTVYLAFGGDEEVGGLNGAAKTSELLAERRVKLETVLDEGGSMVSGVLPGIDGMVAMVGTGEKGYLSLTLRAKGAPGHSSQPEKVTAIYRLARAITLMVETPMPARVGLIANMFRHLGSSASFLMQLVFGNLWLFGPLAKKQLEANKTTNATIRTTMAPTIIQGGLKDNILPAEATAVVNFRLMPGDTIEKAVAYVKRAIDDPEIEFEIVGEGAWEASPVSPDDTLDFVLLSNTIRALFPGTAVTPYLVLGATDSRHYASICSQVYRFSPYQLESEDLRRMHGINERLAVESLVKMVQFFGELIPSWTANQ